MSATITVTIGDSELWEQFDALGNEMIVMKKGRSLFPLLNYYVNGLVPNLEYAVKLHMEAIDDKRYRFEKGQWTNALRADPIMDSRQIYHVDGVKSGAEWMKFPIGFKSAKLTNDMLPNHPMHIPLQTMRKYRPVLTIIQVRKNQLTGQVEQQCQQEFRIPITEFIAVTAYQNKNINALKTANNKYAKQFRETSKKRKRTMTPDDPKENAKEPAPKRAPLIETTNQPPMPNMNYYNHYNQQQQYVSDNWNQPCQQYCEWPNPYEYQQHSYYYQPPQQHNQYWNGV